MKSRLTRRIASILIMIMTFGFWSTSSSSETSDLTIERIIGISGIRTQLQGFPAALMMTIPADMFTNNRERSSFHARIKDLVTFESLLEIFRETMVENFDQENLKKVLTFYESGLGRRIGQLQGAALTSHMIKGAREGRKVSAGLDEDRLKILERLIENLETHKNNIAFRSMVVSLLGADYGNQNLDPEDPLLKKLRFIQKSFERDPNFFKEIALTCFANTYRSLNNSELEALAKFYESQEGDWFQKTVSKAFEKVILKTIGTMERAFRNSRVEGSEG